MSEAKCGTFMDWSFGGILRRIRISEEMTLREFAQKIEMDVGNYSKLENSRLAPPRSKKKIERICAELRLPDLHKDFLMAAAYNFHLGKLQKRFE